MAVTGFALACHNWVRCALGGRAEEVHKQSNYVLVDVTVCGSSRAVRGRLINRTQTSAPASSDTARWNELMAGTEAVLTII